MQSNYFDCRLALSLTLLCGSLIAFSGCTSELNSAHPDANASTEGHVIISSSEMNAILTSNPKAQFYYVSVQGTRRGNGSQSNPWNLSTVCSGNPGFGDPRPPSVIQPGDTIYLRGGTYTGTFRCGGLNGTAAAPIILRAYPGERAIIDNPSIVAGDVPSTTPLWLEGSYIWVIGLEITDSNPLRTGDQKANGYARPIGVVLAGVGTKLINSYVHDVGVGAFPGLSQQGGEVYGNLFYNNGWLDQGTFGSTGYAMYSQNDTGTKLWKDNFIFNNYGYGIQIFSNGNGNIMKGFDIIGNTLFGAGAPTNSYKDTVILGGYTGAKADRINLDSNFFYNGLNGGCCALIMGYNSSANLNLKFTNNQVVGTPIELNGWQSITWTGNRFLFGSNFLIAQFPATYSVSNYNVGGNEYHCPAGNCLPSNWTSQGLDSTSTISSSPISGPASVYVRRNVYDPNRTHIIIYNWSGGSTVSVDVSSVLTIGAQYELRNVQDYFGAPVLTGVYNRQPLQVPMNGLKVAAPIGGKAPAPTGPNFNAFILITR